MRSLGGSVEGAAPGRPLTAVSLFFEKHLSSGFLWRRDARQISNMFYNGQLQLHRTMHSNWYSVPPASRVIVTDVVPGPTAVTRPCASTDATWAFPVV